MNDRLKLPLLAAALPALLLAGCSSQKAKDEKDQRTASGQVLQGTISDAMIPLAQVTSQPPRLKVQPTEEASEDAEATPDSEPDVPAN